MLCNFFFRIDAAARAAGGSIRNQIYNYLEVHLPCTKQTILMRAKKIRIQREEAKTNKILKQLKSAVDTVMSDIISSYENECKRISELNKSSSAAADGLNLSDKPSEQMYKNPKRKFVWNETTRYVFFYNI